MTVLASSSSSPRPKGGPRPRAQGLGAEPLQVSSAAGRLYSTPYLLLLQVDRVVTGQQGAEAGRTRPRPRTCHVQAQTEVESDDV